MSAPAPRAPRIDAEDVAGVTVVTFAGRTILDEEGVEAVGGALFRLVDELGRRRVVVSLAGVGAVSSALLAKLITLHRKLQITRGRLALSDIPDGVRDVFDFFGLGRIFTTAAGPLAAADYPALFDDIRPERVGFAPAWRTDTVLSLAKHMHASADFSAMPILGDALQDAGCNSDAILTHCRGPGPHARGCWVVDFVLAKE